jgi:hypothetical protein
MPLSDEYLRRSFTRGMLAIQKHEERRRARIRFVLQLAVVAFFSFVAGCMAAEAGWFRWR